MKKLTILFSLLIFFGCSNDDSKNEEPETQDPNAIIADNVVVILTENSELISSDSELSSGIYKIQFNQTIPEIETNDIIVGDEGVGFLRKVTSISGSNNVLTMQTSQANMEDVFGNTNINFSTDLSSFNRSSSNMQSQRMNYEQFAQGVSRNPNSFIFNFSNVVINSNTSANFRISNGSLTFNPTYVFDLDYSFFSLDRFEFSTQNTQFNAHATLNLDASASGTIPTSEYVLYENSNTFVRPVGGIPVVVTIFFKLKAVSAITIGGNLSLEQKLEHNTTLSLGATYENSTWTPIAELNSGFVEHPVDLGGSYFNLNESISIVPEVIIAFYGINGPLIEPSLSGNFGLNFSATTQDWDAYLNASIDLSLGASIGVLGETLISLPYDSYNLYTQPIWNAPESIQVVSGNNQIGNQGEQLTEPLKVRVWDNSGLFYLKDVPVYFDVTSGNGTVNNQNVMTDDNGFAEVLWSLGDNTDAQTVKATVKKADGTNIESIATFNANYEDNQIDLSGLWNFSPGIMNGTFTQYDSYGNVTITGETIGSPISNVVFNNDNTLNASNSYTGTYSLGASSISLNAEFSNTSVSEINTFNGNWDDSNGSFTGLYTREIEEYLGGLLIQTTTLTGQLTMHTQ